MFTGGPPPRNLDAPPSNELVVRSVPLGSAFVVAPFEFLRHSRILALGIVQRVRGPRIPRLSVSITSIASWASESPST